VAPLWNSSHINVKVASMLPMYGLLYLKLCLAGPFVIWWMLSVFQLTDFTACAALIRHRGNHNQESDMRPVFHKCDTLHKYHHISILDSDAVIICRVWRDISLNVLFRVYPFGNPADI